MAFVDEVKNAHLLDPGALLVISEIWDGLDSNWKRAIRSECESGEDLWAMELALQGALEVRHSLSVNASNAASSAAKEIGGDFSRLVNNSLKSLSTVG